MKKMLLLGLAVWCLCDCAVDMNLERQRMQLAHEWVAVHGTDDVTISCPSKKYGTPFCDVVSFDGKQSFYLGCHLDTKPQFCFPWGRK